MLDKKILITGGAGFIGSHVVEKLLEDGYKLVVVDNFSTGKKANLVKSDNIKLYNMNIIDEELQKIFEEERPDIVIHFAAQISVAFSSKNPLSDAMQNIIASLHVIDCCKKYDVKRLIVSSSAAVYGDPEYLPVDENHPTNPMSQYGLSKLTMEKYIQLSGLDYLIVRFSNVYGPRQALDGEAGVITIFANAMKNNEPIYINGDGEQVRDFIYVKDIAKIISQLIEKDVYNKIINISTGKGMSINDLFKGMAKEYNYLLAPIYNEKRANDIKVSILSNNKLISEIGEQEFKFVE